jgi:hypothetical protein
MRKKDSHEKFKQIPKPGNHDLHDHCFCRL